MSITSSFEQFCKNLRMSENIVNTIRDRYQRITQNINQNYWDSDSLINHSWYVGSYGRGTEIWTSDIDILIQLPYSTYAKFNSYSINGQSALLQEVKSILQRTYSRTELRGDGQVVCINFSDCVNFEIVPAFINNDDTFTYPDTNQGGSWKVTNPKEEIRAINNLNSLTNKNLKRLCRMARAWKQNCNVNVSGILIDTLAYNFIKNYAYRDKSFVYYDWISRDFFKYLSNQSSSQERWLVPGSNRYIYEKNHFQYKANLAYIKACEAISNAESNYVYSATLCWREIYGTKFPW